MAAVSDGGAATAVREPLLQVPQPRPATALAAGTTATAGAWGRGTPLEQPLTLNPGGTMVPNMTMLGGATRHITCAPAAALTPQELDLSNSWDALRVGAPSPRKRAIAKFHDIDTDKGGTLDKDEIREGLQRLWGRHLTDEEVEEIFGGMDTDASGDVSLKEFLFGEHFFRKRYEREHGKAPKADKDGGESSEFSNDSLEEAVEEHIKHFSGQQAIDFWDPCNDLYEQRAAANHGRFSACRWILFLLVGIFCGLTAVLLKQCIERMMLIRLHSVEDIVFEDAPLCVKESDGGHGGLRYIAHGCTDEDLEWTPPNMSLFRGGLLWVLSSVVLAGIGAAVPLFFAPSAAGSGLPQVMGYLNGVNIPSLLTARVLFAKLISCIVSVASGLPVGPEGPIVHMGSIIGAQVPQLHRLTRESWATSTSCAGGILRYIQQAMRYFEGLEQQRDFITCGAAAGVAAAFGAPVGGLLFVMEDIATCWSRELTHYIFLSTAAAFFVVVTFGSLFHGWEPTGMALGRFSVNAQVLFNPTDVISQIQMSINVLLPSMAVGIFTGVIACVFTKLNLTIFAWRMRVVVPRRPLRIIEPMLIALVYGSLTFCLPMVTTYVGGCNKMHPGAAAAGAALTGSASGPAASPARAAWALAANATSNATGFAANDSSSSAAGSMPDGGSILGALDAGSAGADTAGSMAGSDAVAHNAFMHWTCGRDGLQGTTFSTMGTLTFSSGEAVVHMLLEMGTPGLYTPGSLSIFLLLYSIFAAYTAGSATATGLVIPILVVGATSGRLFVEVSGAVIPSLHDYDWFDAGVFALIGAGAFFSGMCRLTVSLAVIMLELSNQLFFIPPMMLAMLLSKWIADRYAREPLYHGLIHRLGMPLLDPMGDQSSSLLNRYARHLMARPVVALRVTEYRGCIRDALSSTHHGFPVVDNRSGVLRGIMLRNQLTRHVVKGAGSDDDMVSLLNDMSTAPFVVHKTFSARQTYRSFQNLGLRHIIVVNDAHQVVGIITRKDLAAALHHAEAAEEHEAGLMGDIRSLGRFGVQLGQRMTGSPRAADDARSVGAEAGGVARHDSLESSVAHGRAKRGRQPGLGTPRAGELLPPTSSMPQSDPQATGMFAGTFPPREATGGGLPARELTNPSAPGGRRRGRSGIAAMRGAGAPPPELPLLSLDPAPVAPPVAAAGADSHAAEWGMEMSATQPAEQAQPAAWHDPYNSNNSGESAAAWASPPPSQQPPPPSAGAPAPALPWVSMQPLSPPVRGLSSPPPRGISSPPTAPAALQRHDPGGDSATASQRPLSQLASSLPPLRPGEGWFAFIQDAERPGALRPVRLSSSGRPESPLSGAEGSHVAVIKTTRV